MAKESSHYVCQACGAHAARWMGRCATCGAWNTFVVETVKRSSSKSDGPTGSSSSSGARATSIADVPADSHTRLVTGIREFDRVLGGGPVAGSSVLIGGDPGVGKSTLLTQALAALARQGHRVLYVSAEESAGQVAARARRLGAVDNAFFVLAESDWTVVERAASDLKPSVVVIDSVQTVRTSELDSAAGTVSQLRELGVRITECAKQNNLCALIVGHVTKDGTLAGPKVLEHVVDVVLAFEGERGHAFRMLRVQKNRFGSSTEVGVFEMTSDGMREVSNPSEVFLRERPEGASGSVVCATSEGTRPILVEVQALISPPSGGQVRRFSNGIDASRLPLILAVLERKCNLTLASSDVFVNVAGGVRVEEPGTDLAIALAIASSAADVALAPRLVVFGEIGLAGEVRSVSRSVARLAEAREMGFSHAIVPAGAAETGNTDANVVTVRTVGDAIWRARTMIE